MSNIRKANIEDINRVMDIWLQANLEAHNFVDPNYWKDNFAVVKQEIQNADVFVVEIKNEIVGFAGLKEDYLAGIFFDQKVRHQGLGTELLNYLKNRYPQLILDVYQKNRAAVNFYQKNGFKTIQEKEYQNQNLNEYQMMWKSGEK
ncbi:GNAT family N-acetyltransferase [Lactobacillus rodentium]|uniref:Acetyltransferase n=1 Tax=Lactobacillus rodentium TaxID=947835 RepID=A0A2Z6T6D8_9LACO|nr:GNAT family N-acetyltransferase [Lactobacillus rodentium]MCR1893828.1 GNAT family N-acetyltransferase [Lactobacillus rodentium]GBG04306.1 acetyltransferase [Lactobacillus rodentium]